MKKGVQNVDRKSHALYPMVICPMTLTDPYNPDFKVIAFLKSNISKTVCFRTKLLENTNRKS